MERREATSIGATLDPSIVERARRGDREAFESIVRDRIGALYRLTLAIVGNEADAADATQETFIAASRQVRSLRDPARLEAWLGRIAINSARMVVRARGRRAVREIRGGDVISLTARWPIRSPQAFAAPMTTLVFSASLSNVSIPTGGRSSRCAISRVGAYPRSRRSLTSPKGQPSRVSPRLGKPSQPRWPRRAGDD